MKVFKILKFCACYVFYRVFRWQREIQPTEQMSAHTALMAVILLIFLYVFAIEVAISIPFPVLFSDKDVLKYLQTTTVILLIMAYVIPYVRYIKTSRYQHLISQYRNFNETRMQTWVRTGLIVLAYIPPIIFSIWVAVAGKR